MNRFHYLLAITFSLTFAANCSLDKQSGSICGNNILEGDEECDVEQFRLGCYEGQPSCEDNCTINTDRCTSFCGDGVISNGEVCDSDNVPVCNSGTVTCSPECDALITDACSDGYCGDGLQNGAETCDAEDGLIACQHHPLLIYKSFTIPSSS